MSSIESSSTTPEHLSTKAGFGKMRVIKNAIANVARGGIGGLIVIVLPPFLTRILSHEAYSTWLLILQLGAYVSFLDFGIQTAVGRFVAHTNELNDFKQRDSIVSTSLAILSGSGLLAILGITVLAWQLPHLFGGMPIELHQEARLALLLVGGSLAFSLPFSVFGGIFIGIQRYDVPAWILGGSKLLGGALAVLLAQSTHSIAWMGFGIAFSTIGGMCGLYFAYRKIASEIKLSIQLISKRAGREIISYCFGITVWTLGMLLVSGLDIAIVGFFDYKSVAYYALAVGLTNFIIQLQSAIFGALMPSAAILGAREDLIGLGNLLTKSTRYGMLLLLITGIPLIIGAKWILTLWVGVEYATHTSSLLQVLVLANIVRLSGLPYATLVVATGQQKVILLSPLVEGISNFLFSAFSTPLIGAMGAAVGTMFGAVISIGFHLIYNMPRTINILVNRKLLIESGLRPLMCAVPGIILYLIFYSFPSINITSSLILILLTVLISTFTAWKYGLNTFERRKLISFVWKYL
jgi:O-antigen/teichoic acid export membrane protein